MLQGQRIRKVKLDHFVNQSLCAFRADAILTLAGSNYYKRRKAIKVFKMHFYCLLISITLFGLDH